MPSGTFDDIVAKIQDGYPVGIVISVHGRCLLCVFRCRLLCIFFVVQEVFDESEELLAQAPYGTEFTGKICRCHFRSHMAS